jgi:hypothetical protein
MRDSLSKAIDRVNAAVDWFIPPKLQSSGEPLQGVRMFLFSHLFGPFLGHTISLSMLFIQGGADLHWWIFFLAVTAFWPMALVLRWTGRYVPLALLSIENLMFCIFWGCYSYGGINSPILPWLVTVPLLGSSICRSARRGSSSACKSAAIFSSSMRSTPRSASPPASK